MQGLSRDGYVKPASLFKKYAEVVIKRRVDVLTIPVKMVKGKVVNAVKKNKTVRPVRPVKCFPWVYDM